MPNGPLAIVMPSSVRPDGLPVPLCSAGLAVVFESIDDLLDRMRADLARLTDPRRFYIDALDAWLAGAPVPEPVAIVFAGGTGECQTQPR